MPRLFGVDIPANKKIEYALRYVYGIGPTRAGLVVKESGFDPSLRAHQLTEQQTNRLAEIITEKGYIVEGDLRRDVLANLKRYKAIQCYRGIRHIRGLPVRGQRTQTNCRTRKGARKTVGVVRKK